MQISMKKSWNYVKEIVVSDLYDEFLNIVRWWNDHDSGSRKWNQVNAAQSTLDDVTITDLTIGANVDMGGFKLTNLGAGSASGNSVRYEQVLLLAGGTMSGNIAMGGNGITGGGTYIADSLQAGVSGTLGTLTIYPSTASKGTLTLTTSANTGNTTTAINAASQANNRTYTIPDATESASFVMSKGSSTLSGVKTFDGQLIGKGTTAADSAATGYIGEYVEAVQLTETNFAATDTYGDLTSISLTAGDWGISLTAYAAANGATVTGMTFAIGTASGNSGTGVVIGRNAYRGVGPNSLTDQTGCVPNFRVSISGTTTYYLKYLASYSVATPKAAGRISARRIR